MQDFAEDLNDVSGTQSEDTIYFDKSDKLLFKQSTSSINDDVEALDRDDKDNDNDNNSISHSPHSAGP